MSKSENIWVVSLKKEDYYFSEPISAFKREPTQKELFYLVWKYQENLEDHQIEKLYEIGLKCDFEKQKFFIDLEEFEMTVEESEFFEFTYGLDCGDFGSLTQCKVTKLEIKDGK